jgi:hypothetical protein
MLTLRDCIALSDLTPEEVEAIAEDKHLPTIIAVEFGSYLVHTRSGEKKIKAIIRDDIAQALAAGDIARAARLKMVLRHFIEEHHAGAAAAGTGHRG